MKKFFLSLLLNTTNINDHAPKSNLLLSFAFGWAERFVSVYSLSFARMEYYEQFVERKWVTENTLTTHKCEFYSK